jgi:hypothetical protein
MLACKPYIGHGRAELRQTEALEEVDMAILQQWLGIAAEWIGTHISAIRLTSYLLVLSPGRFRHCSPVGSGLERLSAQHTNAVNSALV